MILDITKQEFDDIFAWTSKSPEATFIKNSLSPLIKNDILDLKLLEKMVHDFRELHEFFDSKNIKYGYINLPASLAFYIDDRKLRSTAMVARTQIINTSLSGNKYDEIFKNMDKNTCVFLYTITTHYDKDNIITFLRHAPITLTDNQQIILPQNLFDGSIQFNFIPEKHYSSETFEELVSEGG